MSPLLLGCTVEAISATLIAFVCVRARKSMREAGTAATESDAKAGELEQKLAALTQQVQIQSSQLQTSERAIAERKRELEAEKARCAQLQSAVRESADGADTQALEQRVSALEEQLEQRESQLQESTAKLAALQATLGQQKSETLASEKREAELEQSLQARLDQRETQLRETTEKLAALQATLDGQKSELEALGKRKAELEQATQAREHQLQVSEQQSQALSARADELQRGLETLVGEVQRGIEAREFDLHRHAQALEEAHTALSARTSEILALEGRCGELERAARTAEEDSRARASCAQELQASLSARVEELQRAAEAQAAEIQSRDQSLSATRAELAEKQGEIAGLAARCGELEQRLVRQSEEERGRLEHERVLVQSLSTHANVLESELAKLTDQTRRDGERIAQLEADTLGQSAQLGTLGAQLDELTRAAQRQVEFAERREAEDQQLLSQLRARNRELEGGFGGEEETRRRGELQALEAANEAGEIQLEAARRQLSQVEQQLRDHADREAELRAATSARASELECHLAVCDSELRQLREQFANAASLAERRARELEERNQRIEELDAAKGALSFTVQATHEAIQSGEILIDELAESRIAALFRRPTNARRTGLPENYVAGLAEGDLDAALRGLLGDAQPLSETSFGWLCGHWRDLERAWNREQVGSEIAYLWADAFHLEAGAESESTTMLALVAAFVDGSRRLLALETGERASPEKWLEMLQGLARRGLNAPRIVVADEELGVWSALDALGWECARQHCWSGKLARVLAALPRERRAQATVLLQEIRDAGSRTAAKALRKRFVKRCGVRFADAAKLVTADWDQLTGFHAFPKEHATDLRAADLVAAPLTAIRLRAAKPKQTRHSANSAVIVWRLLSAGIGSLPRLDPLELVPSLIRGQPENGPGGPRSEPAPRSARRTRSSLKASPR